MRAYPHSGFVRGDSSEALPHMHFISYMIPSPPDPIGTFKRLHLTRVRGLLSVVVLTV